MRSYIYESPDNGTYEVVGRIIQQAILDAHPGCPSPIGPPFRFDDSVGRVAFLACADMERRAAMALILLRPGLAERARREWARPYADCMSDFAEREA